MSNDIKTDWQAALVESFRNEADMWINSNLLTGLTMWRHKRRCVEVKRIIYRRSLLGHQVVVLCDAGELTGAPKVELLRIMGEIESARESRRKKERKDGFIYSLTRHLEP